MSVKPSDDRHHATKSSDKKRAAKKAAVAESPKLAERADPNESSATSKRAGTIETPGFRERHEDAPDKPPIPYIRFLVRMFYDLQRLRLQAEGRVRAAEGGRVQLTAEDAKRIEAIMKSLYALEEKQLLKEVRRVVEAHPVWPFFKAVKGCGPAMAGVLLAEVEIEKAERPSDLWRYAGQAVVDGRAEKRTKGEKLHYNAFLKTKLFVLASCLMRANDPRYRQVYDNARVRYENKPCAKSPKEHVPNCKSDVKGMESLLSMWKAKGLTAAVAADTVQRSKCSPAHINRKAQRYMIKMFLLDLWRYWREAAGLPIVPSYNEGVLGHVHRTGP
jgi:hypothetical protein